MKLVITTTYTDFDKKWLKWYLRRLNNEQVLPGSTSVVSKLEENGFAEFESLDPTSDCKARTTYQILNDIKPPCQSERGEG